MTCSLWSPRPDTLIYLQNGEKVFIFSAQLEQLRQQNMQTQGYRFAKSTRTNVLSQIRQWLYFALYFQVTILPASALNLCLFMELMGNTSGYRHCKNVLSGVKFLHGATGNDFPESDFLLETTLQGLKRKLAGTPKQVLPIGAASYWHSFACLGKPIFAQKIQKTTLQWFSNVEMLRLMKI
jgi:hypothetical protein